LLLLLRCFDAQLVKHHLTQPLDLPTLPDRSVMSWLSWTSLVPTFLIVSASLAWWFTEPKNARINLIAAAGAALFCWAIAPELCRDLSYSAYALTLEGIAALHLHIVIARHANMLLTGLAVGWYVGVGCCSCRCKFRTAASIPHRRLGTVLFFCVLAHPRHLAVLAGGLLRVHFSTG
jgi:hypothetical protein